MMSMENNDNQLCRMNLIGIRYSPQNAGIYALILQEEGGDRCLPIVIGTSEAQSIECKLQEIITPRPLTHDLMTNIMRAFGLQLHKVELKRLDSGVYAADLHLSGGEREVMVDSRSSDAIALAIRVGAPIYAPSSLLDEVGIRKVSSHAVKVSDASASTDSDKTDYSDRTDAELRNLLEEAVDNERYEEAARIKKAMDLRCKKDLEGLED